jgi:hypothetical protein
MERFHMTKSLLESWQYVYDCWEGGEEKAQEDFLRTLNREGVEETEAMLNGQAFEDRVHKAMEGETIRSDAKWRTGALAIADILKGAQWQVRFKRDIEVDGMVFELDGILDALKAGVIYDVKFLNKSMNGVDLYGKYLDCSQHPAYFYLVPEAREFQYLVSDGEDVYIETYQREHSRHIGEFIHDFIGSVRGMGLLELYKEKWRL